MLLADKYSMFIFESTLENKEILRKDFSVRFLKTTFFYRRAETGDLLWVYKKCSRTRWEKFTSTGQKASQSETDAWNHCFGSVPIFHIHSDPDPGPLAMHGSRFRLRLQAFSWQATFSVHFLNFSHFVNEWRLLKHVNHWNFFF